MTLVPGGAFIMGKSDDDLADIQDALKPLLCVPFIWMKQKSLTVSTKFVEWVKDSTMRVLSLILADMNIKPGDGKGKRWQYW
jgi:hypothetical protein